MTTTLKRCTSRRTPFGDPCDQEAVITVLIGCVHEHLKEVSLCQQSVESLAHGTSACIACFEVDGHVCEMSLLREVTS